jgi:NADH dehydrogenase [ubiquinone] 1 alpha subcomplex assembly factor 5
MATNQNPPVIFDARRRRALRDRAAQMHGKDLFLWEHMADDLADRLSCISRTFAAPLLIGPLADLASRMIEPRHGKPELAPTSPREASKLGVQPIREDQELCGAPLFDLIVAAGTLDSVNDLPGALVQMRRALLPDGLLLVCMFGAGSLASLKAAMLAADGNRPSAHIHPQIELKSASDLLTRAGFALPVADRDSLDARYKDWRTAISDIRAHGIGNALTGHRPFLGKDYCQRLDAAWKDLADGDGRVTERFELLNLSGWAPSPRQPQPARRGSGLVSLTQVLPDRSS